VQINCTEIVDLNSQHCSQFHRPRRQAVDLKHPLQFNMDNYNKMWYSVSLGLSPESFNASPTGTSQMLVNNKPLCPCHLLEKFTNCHIFATLGPSPMNFTHVFANISCSFWRAFPTGTYHKSSWIPHQPMSPSESGNRFLLLCTKFQCKSYGHWSWMTEHILVHDMPLSGAFNLLSK